MNNSFVYRIYVSGEKVIAGYFKDNQTIDFTENQIEELKKLSEKDQEKYALTYIMKL
jgi:hypothetical protein